MSIYYFETLIPIAGGVVVAWLTGSFRKYGHYLERLNDLAGKMPAGSPARAKLDEAVQEEAARLLSKPPAIRHCETILLTIFCLAVLILLYARLTSQGMGPADVGSVLWLIIFTSIIFGLIATVVEFHVRSLIRSKKSSSGTKAHAPEVEVDESAEVDVRDAPIPGEAGDHRRVKIDAKSAVPAGHL